LAFDPVAAMKFALEHQNPSNCGMITSNGKAWTETYFRSSMLLILKCCVGARNKAVTVIASIEIHDNAIHHEGVISYCLANAFS
jgi:hypothetical protein